MGFHGGRNGTNSLFLTFLCDGVRKEGSAPAGRLELWAFSLEKLYHIALCRNQISSQENQHKIAECICTLSKTQKRIDFQSAST